MLRTRVGYAGGTSAAPTYSAMGDHTEALQVDFDPRRLEFSKLAEIFLASHDPSREPWSIQYRSVLFAHDANQRSVTQAAAREFARSTGKPVVTPIEEFTDFTLAEDYHQKYRLRSVRLVAAEYQAQFKTSAAFLGSVAVTKANAFVGGYGRSNELRDILPSLGLSEAAQAAARAAL